MIRKISSLTAYLHPLLVNVDYAPDLLLSTTSNFPHFQIPAFPITTTSAMSKDTHPKVSINPSLDLLHHRPDSGDLSYLLSSYGPTLNMDASHQWSLIDKTLSVSYLFYSLPFDLYLLNRNGRNFLKKSFQLHPREVLKLRSESTKGPKVIVEPR